MAQSENDSITFNSDDPEEVVERVTEFMSNAWNLPRHQTEPGVRAALEEHRAMLDRLMARTEPEDVGEPAAAAACFTMSLLEGWHAHARIPIALECCKSAQEVALEKAAHEAQGKARN